MGKNNSWRRTIRVEEGVDLATRAVVGQVMGVHKAHFPRVYPAPREMNMLASKH